MFLPYAHDQAVRRTPWATITIVALNFAVFAITRLVLAHRDLGSYDDALSRLQEAQASAYHEHVRSIRPNPDTTAGKPPLAWDAFLAALPKGDVPGVSAAKMERWVRADERLRALRNANADLQLDLVFNRDFRPWQLVTHMFMHGGWAHILGNMWILALCAPALEYRFGVGLFLVLYLVGGLVSAAAMLPACYGTDVRLLGASGAASACIGAFFVRHAKSKVRFVWLGRFLVTSMLKWGELQMPGRLLIGLWLLQQLMVASIQGEIGVAVMAHLGGFAYGAALALVLRRVEWEKRLFEKRILRGGEASPDDEDTDLALSLADKCAWRDAGRYCIRALEKHPDHPVLLAVHARSLAHVGDVNEARQALTRAIDKTKPTEPTEHLLDAARTLAERVPSLGLDATQGLILARWLEDDGEPGDALWAYRDIAEAHPSHPLAPKALFRVADLHARVLGNPELAANTYRAFLERYPEHPLAPTAHRALDGLPVARPTSIPLQRG